MVVSRCRKRLLIRASKMLKKFEVKVDFSLLLETAVISFLDQ